jgi:hypothetical protein
MTYAIDHSGAIRYICFCETLEEDEPTLGPTTPPTPVEEEYCINFEYDANGYRVGHGDYVGDEWIEWGLSINVYPNAGGYAPENKGRIMDTAHPGSDTDLGSPNEYCAGGGGPGVGDGGIPGAPGANCRYEGNILIIQEESDRDVDDNASGGSIQFSFTHHAATLKSMGLMDLDVGESASLDIHKKSGAYTNIPVVGLGDNSVQDYYFTNEQDVTSLQLNLVMSGAVRYLCYSLHK